MLDTPCILSCLRAGHVSEGSFYGDDGTDGSELAAGVGAGGGQPESNAWAWRSLTADQPFGTRVSNGARREATQAGGGPRQEERHGQTVEVHIIIHHRINPVRRGFE
jgi:hypothetical protein